MYQRNPKLSAVREAREMLDRVDTYDDIVKFERRNAALLFDENCISSTDDEPELLEQRLDKKQL